MAAFAVHPGAVEPYEQLASLPSVEPRLSAYYVRLARMVPRVLEYGAGAGALSWAMARAGARVTAVDRSDQLLRRLREQAHAEPAHVARRIEVRQGDMRELRLRSRFPLVVCPAGTFQHLYNRADVEAHLEKVRSHLAPGGRFVLDVGLPQPQELAGDYDPISQVLWKALGPSSSESPNSSIWVAQRQYFPRELKMLLWYNGLRVIRMRIQQRNHEAASKQMLLVVATSRNVSQAGHNPRNKG